MKKLILAAVVVSTMIGVTSLNSQEAYAFGGRGRGKGEGNTEHREEIMTKKAEILGISLEELKEAWENRTVHELLEEKGLTREDIWNSIKDTIREHMIENGLTSEEIDERFARKEEHMQRRLEWRENNPDAEKPFRHHLRGK